jgi:hypothetical protein
MAKRAFHHKVKHFLVPHKGNKYKPGLFARRSVAIVALVLLMLEGAYLVQVNIIANRGYFAAVLPAALTALANADRAAQGLPAVAEDSLLDQAAQAKANDMAQQGYFAHVSPSGKTPWYWLDQVGYPYTYAGENLAVDFTDSTDVEQAWMNSPMHRANILKQEYTHVGIGVAQGMYQGKEVTFVAQFFATKQGEGAVAVAAPSPARKLAAVPAEQPVETAAAAPRVLGESAQPAAAPDAGLAVVSTSPSRMMWYIVTGVTALIALFFSLTLFVHVRRKLFYIEVVGGGFALIAVALLILYYNGLMPSGEIAHDSQAASVARAL